MYWYVEYRSKSVVCCSKLMYSWKIFMGKLDLVIRFIPQLLHSDYILMIDQEDSNMKREVWMQQAGDISPKTVNNGWFSKTCYIPLNWWGLHDQLVVWVRPNQVRYMKGQTANMNLTFTRPLLTTKERHYCICSGYRYWTSCPAEWYMTVFPTEKLGLVMY